jgi:hypothetical protein
MNLIKWAILGCILALAPSGVNATNITLPIPPCGPHVCPPQPPPQPCESCVTGPGVPIPVPTCQDLGQCVVSDISV